MVGLTSSELFRFGGGFGNRSIEEESMRDRFGFDGSPEFAAVTTGIASGLRGLFVCDGPTNSGTGLR